MVTMDTMKIITAATMMGITPDTATMTMIMATMHMDIISLTDTTMITTEGTTIEDMGITTGVIVMKMYTVKANSGVLCLTVSTRKKIADMGMMTTNIMMKSIIGITTKSIMMRIVIMMSTAETTITSIQITTRKIKKITKTTIIQNILHMAFLHILVCFLRVLSHQ
jgi:hypothetical protein